MNVNFPTFEAYLQNNLKKNGGPYLATDVIIEYSNGIVLIERKNFPHGLALPGGIAERLTLAENAIKEGKEETGLDVKIFGEHQPFCVFSDINQDPRAFIVSVTYIGKGTGILRPNPKEDAKSARVYGYEEVGKLLKTPAEWAFEHHRKIVELYYQQIWSRQHQVKYEIKNRN